MTRIIVSVPGVTFDNMLFGDGWQLGDVEGWWDTTKPRIVSDARPEWHGDFGQDTAYLEPRFITVSGVFQSRENPDLVTSARDTLAALHEAGEFEFTVSDGAVGRVTARMASELAWDVDYAPGCASFEFTVKADDPRRYGVGQSFGTGVPTAGVGVDDPVLDPVQEGVAVDVATNYAPSLYGPTVPVEVRRNYARNPCVGGSLANLGGTRVTLSLGTDYSRGTITDAVLSTFSQRLSPDAATASPGDVFTLSARGRTTAVGQRMSMAIQFLDASNTQIGWVSAPETVVNSSTFTPLNSVVATVAPAGTAKVIAWIGIAGTDARAVGDTVDVQRVLLEKSPTVNGYFDGTTSPDPDMTARWLGAANASESVLEGQHPTAFTDASCVSIIHEVGDGTRELRQIPTTTLVSANSYTAYNIPAMGTLQTDGTYIATLRLPAPQTGTLNTYARSVWADGPSQITPRSPNVAGTYQHRLHYTNLTSVYRTYLYAGGTRGSGDVYWSKIGLYAGDYTGDWFDGNTQPHDTYIYKWAGVPYESVAIKQQIVHTPGNPGRIELTNTGTAPSEPMVRVTGGLSDGFELLCIETGDVVRVTRPIPDGSVIDVDMGAGQVWIDQQSPLSAMYVPVAEWFSVKPGHTCTIQFTPFGVVTGTPTMSVEFAEASW